jgi:hypothetical protein
MWTSNLDQGCNEREMWFLKGRRQMHTGLWWGKLKERGHLEDPGADGSILLKLIVNK